MSETEAGASIEACLVGAEGSKISRALWLCYPEALSWDLDSHRRQRSAVCEASPAAPAHSPPEFLPAREGSLGATGYGHPRNGSTFMMQALGEMRRQRWDQGYWSIRSNPRMNPLTPPHWGCPLHEEQWGQNMNVMPLNYRGRDFSSTSTLSRRTWCLGSSANESFVFQQIMCIVDQ